MFRLVCAGPVHHCGFVQLTLEPRSGVVVVGGTARFLALDVPACTRFERLFFLLSPRTMVAGSGVRGGPTLSAAEYGSACSGLSVMAASIITDSHS